MRGMTSCGHLTSFMLTAGQVWNRVLAPMSGQKSSEEVAEGAVGILEQGLQVRYMLLAAWTSFMICRLQNSNMRLGS